MKRMTTQRKEKSKEWEVYFDGNLWGHKKGGSRCREIPVEKTFYWGEEKWRIPSVYAALDGLVVDFCVEVEPERIRAFMEKWNLWGGEPAEYEEDTWRQMEAENPLDIEIFSKMILDGKELSENQGCSVTWNPCIPETARKGEAEGTYAMKEAKSFLEHYGCDASKGWIFKRYAFRREEKERLPALRDVRIRLERKATYFAGAQFTAGCPGQEIRFSHPVTGIRHILTVTGIEQEKLEEAPFDDTMEFPSHYVRMTYILSPELPEGEITVQDCGSGDAPRPNRKKAAALGLIGGASGATAIFLAEKGKREEHMAFSALHFEKADTVEWRIGFHVKMLEDIEVAVL